MKFVTTRNSKNVITTPRIITIKRSELIFLLILYFHDCKYLSWTFSRFNCKNSLTQFSDLIYNCNQNLMHLFCDVQRRYFNLFKTFENQAVQTWSKRGWASALHKNLRKRDVLSMQKLQTPIYFINYVQSHWIAKETFI